MSAMQTSLVREIACSGIGLHSGESAHMRLRPASSDTGIRFVRTDLTEISDPVIPARIDSVTTTQLGTNLANAANAKIATIEHLLAACSGLELDNLIVEIDGPEIPVLDGSALPFCRLLQEAGLCKLDKPRKYMRILEAVQVRQHGACANLSPVPDERFSMDVTIEFEDTAIGRSQKSLTLSPDSFRTELAPARTFAFAHEIDALQEQGLARGGSLDNAILVDGMRIVNKDPLRFEDEFVRHKMLDAVGDLALAEVSILGHFKAFRPGHAINTLLLRTLMETPQAWSLDAPCAPIPA